MPDIECLRAFPGHVFRKIAHIRLYGKFLESVDLSPMLKGFAFSLSTLLWAALAAQAQPVISDPPFETPSVGACPASELTPPGTGWVFGASAGITTAGCGQRFNAPKAPDGGQVGFIQVYTISAAGYVTSLSQTVAGFQAGHSYAISFYSASRPANGDCNDGCRGLNFSVTVGSTDVLDVVNPPSNAFQQYTTNPFTASGSVTITFMGSATVGTDATSSEFQQVARTTALPFTKQIDPGKCRWGKTSPSDSVEA